MNPSSNLSLIPLRQASLCLDCETITTTHTNCHACGSQALLNVARALNRQHLSDRVCAGRRSVVKCPWPTCAKETRFTEVHRTSAETEAGTAPYPWNLISASRRTVHEAQTRKLRTCLQLVGGVRGETAHGVGRSPGVENLRNPSFPSGPGAAVDTVEHMFAIEIWSE